MKIYEKALRKSSTQVGGLQVEGQPSLHNETLSEKETAKQTNEMSVRQFPMNKSVEAKQVDT